MLKWLLISSFPGLPDIIIKDSIETDEIKGRASHTQNFLPDAVILKKMYLENKGKKLN